MRRSASVVALLLPLVAASPGSAAAAPADDASAPGAEPPVTIAFAAGIATTLLPMVLGATYVAAHQADGPRDVGVAVSGVGPALAPIVAHAVLGEWKRAALFGALPVASEIGIGAYLSAEPDGVFHGTVGTRTLFGLLYTCDILTAALGMVDVLMARERATERGRRAAGPLRGMVISPSLGRGRAGLVLGGSL